MKKILMTALVASMMLVPFGAAAAVDQVEIPAPPQQMEFVPGTTPAEDSLTDVMSPAIHAAVLAMMNHQVSGFDTGDTALSWEGLYNILSMYGQLDERVEYQGAESLLIPAETVADYAAALLPGMELEALPESLADRMTYDAASDSYLVVCGNAEMTEMVLTSAPLADGQILLTGSLVAVEDGSHLAEVQAVMDRADNLLGCELVSLALV